MKSNSEIGQAVKTLAARVFRSEDVHKVLVTADYGATGEDILLISIVFKRRPKSALRPDDISELRRATIAYLAGFSDTRFPVLNFLTADELDQINAAQ